jgi:hypothetical protein
MVAPVKFQETPKKAVLAGLSKTIAGFGHT